VSTSVSPDAPAPHPLRVLAGALAVTALDAALVAGALGGVRPLLAHPRALALLAVWAVGSLTLGALRPVRAQDLAEVRRERAPIMWLLFALPLAAPPLAAWGERAGIWWLASPAALPWAAIALAAAGTALRIAAMARLGPRFSPQVALQRVHALETRGVYARVRHPGYLGAWLAALGGALAFRSALGLPAVALMALLLEVRARREEALLEQRFGAAFRAYRGRAGRFLPRLRAARPPEED